MAIVPPPVPNSERAQRAGSRRPKSASVWVAGYAFIAVLWLGIAELILFFLPGLAGSDLVLGRLYWPPSFTGAEYDAYLAMRDPVLGWPAPRTRGHGDYDTSGARVSPAHPAVGNECITLYGESFTFGDEVGNSEAWGNLLAQRLGCRVGNFGVKGYGTDQALLRFQHNPSDTSRVVVLGIYADNLLRNVNQQNYFLTGSTPFAMKPRFALDGEASLRLVPISNFTYAQMMAALRDPQTFWKDEALLPGSPDGPITWSFPHTLSFARLLASRHMWDFLTHRPRWMNFYRPDHPSHALTITVAIAEEFHRIANERGKSAVVVLYPAPRGYDEFRRTGVSPFQPLTDALRKHGISTFDLSEDFSRELGDRKFCDIVTFPRSCRGHYNPEGNLIVATAMERYLVAEDLLHSDR
jgi:hypothetical protein